MPSNNHPITNGDRLKQTSTMDTNASTAQNQSKKTKGKKAADPINTSKAIEDTIAQLERSRAGDKEQEMEIDREVKKATRDLSNLLSTIETPMSRIEIIQRKYSDLLAEMKKTEREYIKSKKRADQLQKEKDTSRSELGKMTTVKDKLEKLCRELQKENKKMKDDNKRLCDTETKMREELHTRLEGMVLDVQEVIEQKENPESLPTDMDLNDMFRQKFKSFVDQYELREIQFQSLLRTKELEISYQAARYEQQKRAQEQEANKSRQLTSQVSTFSQTETELRSQLNIYVEKFKQVEDTLNNSNDLFQTFRKEMEEMSKKTKRLEKENNTLTRKHELTNHNILQMAEERTKSDKEIALLRKKNANLEKLCRGMQQQGRGQLPNPEMERIINYDSEGTESEYEYEVDEHELDNGSTIQHSNDLKEHPASQKSMNNEESRHKISSNVQGQTISQKAVSHTPSAGRFVSKGPRLQHSSQSGQTSPSASGDSATYVSSNVRASANKDIRLRNFSNGQVNGIKH